MNVGTVTADWAKLWTPSKTGSLSEWAEDEHNIVLSPEYSARTGPLRLYGWQRGILDAFTDPTVETLVLMCGTQLIKTLLQQLAIAYVIANSPAPMLVVMPKEDDAETFSKERLEPMIRDCPSLRDRFGKKAKDRLNTTLFKRFPGGSLSLVGAGVPGNAARRSICYAFLDEIDKYLRDVGKEGDFIDLVRERLATFGTRKKLVLACSPTRQHTSRIGRAYEQSDQRQPWVACPNCNEWQVLKWAQVKWENELPLERRPGTAHYECGTCGYLWNDHDRWAACENTQWRARKPFTGIAGFWISHLYSPWKTIAEITERFLQAKDDKRALQVFVNTNLAELWAEEGDTPEWEILVGRAEKYPFGSEPAVPNENAIVPMRALFLTAFVDVQEDRLEYEVTGWGRHKESWSIAYGVIRVMDDAGRSPLPTSNPAIWLELEKVLSRDWKHESGETMPIMVMGIDTGFRPKPVYEFAKRHAQPAYGPAGLKVWKARTVCPTKGSSTETLKLIAGVSKEDAARKRQGVRIVSIGTSVGKQDLFDSLRLPRPTQALPVPGYCHFPEYGEEFFRGLCSEKRIIHEDDSVTWEKLGRNEPLDCRVGNMAAAAIFGVERFGEKQWQFFEQQLKVRVQLPVMKEKPTAPPEALLESDPSPAPARFRKGGVRFRFSG